jgi:hypothetical protein
MGLISNPYKDHLNTAECLFRPRPRTAWLSKKKEAPGLPVCFFPSGRHGQSINPFFNA